MPKSGGSFGQRLNNFGVGDVVIENPILNTPFAEPTRHWHIGKDGITDQIVEKRRRSTYFIPIPPPKKKTQQLALQEALTEERETENELINQIRQVVGEWRLGRYQGVTPTTRTLLEYWTDPGRERRLFFCQIEAVETVIYLAEVADRFGQGWIRQKLRLENEAHNPGLYRLAVKMATGSGKTVVIAMLIAWQALNKLANQQDARFSDTFLIVTPGITIKDRLRVLLPNDPQNYYEERDILRPDQLVRLQQAQIVITNFHAFSLREKPEFNASSLTKKVLAGPGGDLTRFKESPGEMVRRVCRALGTKKNVVVINDEAHHCYRERPQIEEQAFGADEREEVKRNRETARVWISGLTAVAKKLGVRAVYDLSATPFFLGGSGYPEGDLFPWVISDFSLVDAIESGIVKIPRVPVSSNQVSGDMPAYRDLWRRIRMDLPKKGAKSLVGGTEPYLPKLLETALMSLYENYALYHNVWRGAGEHGMPPVFIVVCNNTAVSKLVHDYIAGWQRTLPDGAVAITPGALPLFSNEEHGAWRARPRTMLIDSAQIDSGAGMDETFKRVARNEIDEFKADLRQRFPDRNADEITDEDLLREVLNTVGKPGRLGESILCVVSVSMLTEGWDANTVTHILGIRAFGTQLLCEQVVGRGLRRMSYEPDVNGMFAPEYAEVYGVPFSFIPAAGTLAQPPEPKIHHRVRALPERAALEIRFPHVIGYRYELPAERITATFGDETKLVLTTDDVPTETVLDPIVGESTKTNLDALRGRREQEVAFFLSKRVVESQFGIDAARERPWLFPQVLEIVKRWMRECLICKDNTFPQMVLIAEYSYAAAERIYKAIVRSTVGGTRLVARLRDYDPIGTTAGVSFDTTKNVYEARKSHLNYVVLDSGWEAKVAEALEAMPEVSAYVKNDDRVGLRIPYTIEGIARVYVPDFIIRWRFGEDREVFAIVEVTGERRKEKAAKASEARDLWVPGVNALLEFGRWAFVEITDPNETEALLRAHLADPAIHATTGA
jgi:type III restriction enzyme